MMGVCMDSGAGGMGGAGGAMSSTGASMSTGEGGAGGTSGGDKGSCGCLVAGAPERGSLGALAALFTAAALTRRRRATRKDR